MLTDHTWCWRGCCASLLKNATSKSPKKKKKKKVIVTHGSVIFFSDCAETLKKSLGNWGNGHHHQKHFPVCRNEFQRRESPSQRCASTSQISCRNYVPSPWTTVYQPPKKFFFKCEKSGRLTALLLQYIWTSWTFQMFIYEGLCSHPWFDFPRRKHYWHQKKKFCAN